jgi:hypothetical protein
VFHSGKGYVISVCHSRGPVAIRAWGGIITGPVPHSTSRQVINIVYIRRALIPSVEISSRVL